LTLVEAAVESFEGALAAGRAGADRIELCVNLDVGGTTPSAALIAAVAGDAQIPVFVLMRPRAGDFVYTRREIDAMTRDIELALSMEIAGIVTGVLNPDSTVNVERTRTLVRAAAGLPVTFHRAFDSAASLTDALERVIDAGASRVLTSGGAATAAEGADTIASLVDQVGGRISIVAGGSIRDHNVRDLIARTGVGEVHSRLVDEENMRSLIDAVRTASESGRGGLHR
jgi:copper homeostasis protein